MKLKLVRTSDCPWLRLWVSGASPRSSRRVVMGTPPLKNTC